MSASETTIYNGKFVESIDLEGKWRLIPTSHGWVLEQNRVGSKTEAPSLLVKLTVPDERVTSVKLEEDSVLFVSGDSVSICKKSQLPKEDQR
jgi:hypothetical protein